MNGDSRSEARARISKLLKDINERNPTWRIFTSVFEEATLVEADAADARRRRGQSLSALDGLAVAIKDNIDVGGQATSVGIGHFRNALATSDAPIVRRMRSAGAIIIGKTNMHEAALGVTTDNPWFGRCENPRFPGFTPGGSSGGSAAAVAAGLCDIALGTDTMGSTRIPAACCGIAGFIPTRGTLDAGGVTPLSARLDSPGLFAKSATDLQVAWQVLSGKKHVDSPDSRHWRIGLMADIFPYERNAEVQKMMSQVVACLRRHGVVAESLVAEKMDIARLRKDCFVLCEIDAAGAHAPALAADAGEFSGELRALLDYGARQSPQRRLDILARLDDARELLLKLFNDFDVLLLPTLPQLPWRHGSPPPPDVADLTVPANVAGLPAICIPWGTASNGLPLSLQILAAPGHDDLLVDIAALMEQWRSG